MMRMIRGMVCLAVLALSCCEIQAGGERAVTRQSSRAQSQSGMYGHFVTIPKGVYEGVAVAGSRRAAINKACFADDPSKVTVSKTVTRGANGMFYSSVLYKSR